MTIILQKSDLAAASFANTNSNGAGGVALRTDAGSAFRAELALNTGAGLVGFIQPGSGAVSRTLQSKGEDVLSVKDYASLQEAVDAAVATNGRLHVPAGIYEETSIMIAGSLILYGEGDKTIIRRAANTDTASPSSATAALFKITAHNVHVSFRDLVLDGNEANQIAYQPYGYLIRLSNVVGTTGDILRLDCENVSFINATQSCIAADGDTGSLGVEELRVTNCSFINGRHGLAQGNVNVASASGYGPDYLTITDRVYATIRGCSFVFDKTLSTDQFSRTAIRITFETNTNDNTDGARTLIDGNYFYGCGRGERVAADRPGNDVGVIDAYARGREIRIVNNLFESSYGVPIRGKTNCDLVVVSGNVVEDTSMNPGINIGPNSYAQQSGTINISNNVLKNTAGYGIGVIGNAGATTSGPANTQMFVESITIANNIIDTVTSWNMQLNPTVGEGVYARNYRSINITGNIVKRVGLNGVWLRGQGGTYSSENTIVSNNQIETANKGITLEASIVGAVTISGNIVSDTVSRGCDIQALSGGGAVLNYTGNSVKDAADYGHYFRFFQSANVIGNSVEAVSGVSRGFYSQDSGITKLAFNTHGFGVTTPYFGGGGGQAANHDFGNTWNAKVMYGGAAAPTVGTWTAGDTVYISAPTAGGNIGHVCVTGGTPGTWKTFGAISI
jgi:hypothetical protein